MAEFDVYLVAIWQWLGADQGANFIALIAAFFLCTQVLRLGCWLVKRRAARRRTKLSSPPMTVSNVCPVYHDTQPGEEVSVVLLKELMSELLSEQAQKHQQTVQLILDTMAQIHKDTTDMVVAMLEDDDDDDDDEEEYEDE